MVPFGTQPFRAVAEQRNDRDTAESDELREGSHDKLHSTEGPVRQNLMSLLSGKQNTKKHSKVKKLRLETETETETEMDFDTVIDPDLVSEDSCLQLKDEYDVMELEKKIFASNNHKSVSVKDFLSSKRTTKEAAENVESGIVSEKVQILQDIDPDVIEIESDKELSSRELEEKIYGGANAKRTSAKDLFKSLRNPKESTNFSKKPSSEGTKSVSALSLLQGIPNKKKEKKSHFITLSIPSESLKEIQRSTDDPFFTKGSTFAAQSTTVNIPSGVGSKNAFQSMMAHSMANTPKLTPLQKLKVLEPPTLERNHFFVVPCSEKYATNHEFTSLKPKTKLHAVENFGEESFVYSCNNNDTVPEAKLVYSGVNQMTQEEILTRIPDLIRTPALSRIYSTFIQPNNGNSSTNQTTQLWTEYFRPIETSHLMLHVDKTTQLKNWIVNAFNRLKTQTLATPRNVQIKKKKRQQLLRGSTFLDNFVVPDDEETDEETEEEVFVPVLIIQGSSGMGKSASVYAALDETRGYVYEVNSGQSRSRRDLYSTLKEFCTTQLVHSNHGTEAKSNKEFQKGIILFEDTDVLFEQDRTFWTVVQDMINISRRPIIITCSDTSNIPKSIIDHAKEDNAILNIDSEVNFQTRAELMNYLWLCSYSQGYDVSNGVLNRLIKRSENAQDSKGFDLRRCLLELQTICNCKDFGSGMIHITEIKEVKDSHQTCDDGELDIETLSNKLDLLSSSDVISSSSTSQIKSHLQENEILDFYIIDESKLVRQKTLPFELNIGSSLGNTIHKDEGHDTVFELLPKRTFNDIRKSVTLFNGSRSKKLPKFLLESHFAYTRRATRSFNNNSSFDDGTSSGNGSQSPMSEGLSTPEWRPDTVGIPDGSICKYLSVTPYILELAPIGRNWATFQASLDIKEIETLAQHNVSVKKFIGWRQFQSDTNDIINTFRLAL
ncbi:hypothetical protein CLIB1423_25S00320 [[Candida] railenensis]|uniref:Telomere length regulation protein ELG1 n=1 Tax=[Candida] railenensis TaxID=45579 RepID=A0A9P0VZS2_9ASCO|nr:hypothetical protein CLIB1423_25S00320 [[Candida] railenensis]